MKLWLLALVLAGAGLRFYYATESRPLKRDEQYRFQEIANHLEQGDGFKIGAHPTAQAMPLWPWLVSKLPDPRLAAALLSTAAILLACWLASILAGPRVAFVVAALMAFDLDQARLGGTILTEPLFTVLLLSFACFWALRATWFAAIFLALAVLTRAEALLIPFALAACTREWKRPLLVAGVVLAALAPWAWRNKERLDAFVPLTTVGGVTLHAAWNEGEMDLPFRKRGQGRSLHFPTAQELAAAGEVAPDRQHRGDAIRFLKDHPGEALKSLLAKAMVLLTPVQRKGTSITYALAILAAWWAVFRARATTRTMLRFAFPFLIVVTLVGLAFLAIPRYRAPYHPFVFLVAASLFHRGSPSTA
ncbi:MAG: hypothetical protein OER88_06485 [Planctomycetota bacterium]|nr:hypothetical protein [Planctomycetota bacterium]